MKQYLDEITGQREFYQRVSIDPDTHHNTDGVDRGNLYENKLSIEDINKVLFQAVKYASRIRIRGERLPANLILNDLNAEKCFIFKSEDLLPEIEKEYFGAASKNNDNWHTDAKYITVDYNTVEGLQELLKYVTSNNFTKYHVEKNNILGLAQEFYKVKQDKNAFLKGSECEIRKPIALADRIYPYTKKDNLEFDKIMDCLNPKLLQRERGAYYTPPAYVKQMQKMLLQAVSEVPEGMDYVIIDRCAGVGNLEEGLPDAVLAHCILSTIEANEYQILQYLYADKSAVVIPETDALAYDIIPAESGMVGQVFNDYVREKVTDPNCVVILCENPPFSEAGSGGSQTTGQKKNTWKYSLIKKRMENEIKGAPTNELSNLFIWSGLKYYLTKPLDSYILFSPTKYWRNQNIVSKKFRDGFLCNRKEFHAELNSAMGCIWWQNIDDYETEKLTLVPYDIYDNKVLKENPPITISKAYILLSTQYDKRSFPDDEYNGIICEKDGTEFVKNGRKVAVSNPIYNKNIIGYIATQSFSIDRKTFKLIRASLYDGHGFYLRFDNFLEKLPLFVAAAFPYSDHWYTTDVYSKSYDGNGKHLQDKEFIKKCFIYTCLTLKNRCRSMNGTDGRFYKNELCFDGDTVASRTLTELELNKKEKDLIKYYNDVLYEIKDTEEYNPNFSYGVWQIKEEINIKIDSGRVDKHNSPVMVIKYPRLNTAMNTLKTEVEKYYHDEIIPDLFKYELIK